MKQRSGNDMVDAFAYSIECLKVERARREKLHKLRIFLLAIAACIVGLVIGWVTI